MPIDHAQAHLEANVMSPTIPTWVRPLRFLLASAILLQTAIVLVCVALGHANSGAGFLQYRLPQFLFWVYVWVGVGAPGTALVTLIVLWARRVSLWNGISDKDKRTLRQLVVLCAVNVCAVVVWFALGGLVFFGAGGNR